MFRDQSWRWDFFQTSPIFQLSSPKIFQNDFKTFVNLVNLERIITSINEKLTKRKKRSRVSLIYVKIFIQGRHPSKESSFEKMWIVKIERKETKRKKERKKEEKTGTREACNNPSMRGQETRRAQSKGPLLPGIGDRILLVSCDSNFLLRHCAAHTLPTLPASSSCYWSPNRKILKCTARW